MKLCCFFNYAPLYRQTIFKEIDNSFDTQFYFGREVSEGASSGIKKLNYDIFKKKPIEFKNKRLFDKYLWRTKCAFLALKNYDTFLITGDFSYSYIPLILLCKILKKRVYGWGHGIKVRQGLNRYLSDFFYKNITGFFSYSNAGRNRLIELGYTPDKITVIYNSLVGHIEKFKDIPSDIYKEYFNNDDPTLIFIGRITEEKKLEWLIQAIEVLGARNLNCNLVLVGNGGQLNCLKQLTKDKGLSDRVWFYGECYDDSKNNELLYNADVCVSPGNVGLTALHALQNGTGVISHGDFDSQGPEYEAIQPFKTGMLYKKNDFESLCDSIYQWMQFSNSHRPEIRENCRNMINAKWNADNQLLILKQVLGT